MKSKLKSKLEDLPTCPGVYTFKDRKGKIIYVGKAKSLRSRVRSYFGEAEPASPRTAVLVRNTYDLDFIAAGSEVEALILECNLIKHFKPRHNVNLKDDKKYPYIKVTTKEPFPTVFVTRNLKQDGSKYFGPYTDAKAMRKSLKVLTDVFPVRMCRKRLPLKRPDRGCLNYHIGKCVGPCRGEISKAAYRHLTNQVCQYLSGRMSNLTRDLRKRMEAEAAVRHFEEAAKLRDMLQALEKISQKQVVVSTVAKDRDVIAVRTGSKQAVGFVLKIREGKLVGKEIYRLSFEGKPAGEEVLTSFLEQYLSVSPQIPQEILIEQVTEGITLIEAWLRQRTGRRIKVLSPKGGKAGELLKMAGRNAELVLTQMSELGKQEPRVAGSVKELGRWLHLPRLPVEIEAFDISTIQGAHPVGSRVYFKNGRTAKSLYRHYAIQTVSGQDDFAMMSEVLRRAWAHVVEGEEECPDLVLIDGGKGQISSAIDGMVLAGASHDDLPPVVGIAKRLDEIFVPDRPTPVQIPHDSPALRLLQRIRDEAHRFAVTYHRKLRQRQVTRSRLEDVSGIGPVLSKRLLAHFGSIGKIKGLTADELAEVPGISRSKADAVAKALKEDSSD
jgi:excinuclease ABC subunit C